MRFATACLVLLLAPAALAQDLPPEAFYPLDVGNEWVYTVEYGGPRFLQHDRIVGIETIGGIEYTRRERCEVPMTPDGPGAPDCAPHLVRVDQDGHVVVRQPDGSELAERCALGAPSGTEVTCPYAGSDTPLTVVQSGPATIEIGYQSVEVEGVQQYDGSVDPPPSGFAVGVGPLAPTTFSGFSRFEYARIQGREFGIHPFAPNPAAFDLVAVGSVRESRAPGPVGPGQIPQRMDSPRALVLGGVTWTLRRTQRLGPLQDGTRTRFEQRELVRFDTAAANGVRRFPDGSEAPVYPCALVFQSVGDACPDGTLRQGYPLQTVEVGGQTRVTPTGFFDNLGGSIDLAAGVGVVEQAFDGAPSGTSLVFADIGPLPTGDPLPFGTPLADFPTETDPTPAHRYYPLSVGDEWHYQFSTVQNPNGYHRRRIVGAEVVEGETFFRDEFSTARPNDAAPMWEIVRTDLVRYDSLRANIVTPFGPEGRFECPLDEPVNTDPDAAVVCGSLFDGEPADIAAFRSTPGTVVQQGGLVVPTESFKQFRYLGGGVDFSTLAGLAAGVGLVYLPGSAATYAALEYARVRQDDGSLLTLGTPLPVGAEDEATGAALAVSVSPNPTAGALHLTLQVPVAGVVTAEAFDALGRRVWSRTVEAARGTRALHLDVSGWAPGTYVARVRLGDAVATARVVRR